MSHVIERTPHSSAIDAMMDANFSCELRELVYRAANTSAKLAGHTLSTGDPNPVPWLSEDLPNRINLILESLGREERL